MTLIKCSLNNNSLNFQGIFYILKRFKFDCRLKEKQNSPCQKALKHFDDFYKTVFANSWHSVRLALLTKPKYVAVINNFGEIEKTEEYLQGQGAFNLKTYFEVQKTSNLNFSAINQDEEESETKLDELIEHKLLQEEVKEAHLLHPEGAEFKAKVDSVKQENEESDNISDYSYKPEDARTSLTSDLKVSQIDKSRLIMPDSPNDLAIMQEFLPVTQLKGAEDFIPESDYYKYYKVKSSNLFSVEEEYNINFPENLKVYSFDRGETLDFPEPTRCCNNVYNYLKIDGGELLAALALNVQPEDCVLDMCSVSGSISYCIFQTLQSKILVCANDTKGTTQDLFKQYLFDDWSTWNDMLCVTSRSVNKIQDEWCLFDKVLVEVPSTFDKAAVYENTSDIFKNTNLRRRLKLPEVQCSLLLKGMELLRPGGTLVYTTSTLSPVQNEGVVNEALRYISQNSQSKFTIIKLSPALRHMSSFFKFDKNLNLKFGTLVMPFVPTNFGPRYICKLVKMK